MPDVILRPRATEGTHDAQVYPWWRGDLVVRLYSFDAGRGAHDVQLRVANGVVAEASPPPPPPPIVVGSLVDPPPLLRGRLAIFGKLVR